MTKLQYAQEIAKEINETTDNVAEAKQVTKNNGVVLTGIMISEGEVSPTFYVDGYYDQGLSASEAADEILIARDAQRIQAEQFGGMVDMIKDWGKAKELVQPRLIGSNNDVSGVPHKDFEDLYIIYAVNFPSDIGFKSSANVTNGLMEAWGITLDELDEVAMKNVKPTFNGMGQLLRMLNPQLAGFDGEDIIPMYVIGNEEGYYGASSILLPEVQARFTEDMYIIPSSVHEMIAVSAAGDFALEIGNMIKEVNRTCVDPTEVLGEDPYYFDVTTKEIRKVVTA